MVSPYTIQNIDHADFDHAVQVADRTWWVGHRQKDDVFQCHVYLIEQGDQSVLIDPGSKLTFRQTLRKIEEILPFSAIRYFICHHQDPDITGVMPLIDELVGREDAVLITHWRTTMLIKHYGLRLPFWLVDKHDWRLELSDRSLQFIFTPYAHFPGAICTFDTYTRVLFSSDIFGAITEQFSLVARDEQYFEAMRPFHEHYMPSREILGHALAQMEKYPIRLIAPQHGSIIPEHLVGLMINKLKSLECGLYLIAKGDTEIQRLSRLNQMLRDITQTMMIYRDFRDIANSLLEITRRALPAESLEFYARLDNHHILHLTPENRYWGDEIRPPAVVAQTLGIDHQVWRSNHDKQGGDFTTDIGDGKLPALLLPLFSPDKGTAEAVALIRMAEPANFSIELEQVITQMSIPLQVAVEREMIYRAMDIERQRIYERSIRDPLTGLFTRAYMQDTVQRLCDLQDRDANALVAAAMLDVDHFKSINDTFGHNLGDVVLQRVAAELMDNIRSSDIPIRLGGEEFIVFAVGETAKRIGEFAERLRTRIAAIKFSAPLESWPVTVSIGFAVRKPKEPLWDFIQRLDQALYEAKQLGRNQVCAALP
jgi:diguanylate cyclase (GGDEF)-like protein